FAALDDGAVQALFAERGWELEGDYNRGMAMAHAFEELCERQLIQPTFVIDFPKETTPLCKAHRDNPDLVERFEPYVAGYEVGNAYSELNDPQVQKEMFEDQAARRQHGDLEAHPYDADFIRALEYGMPPMGGIGLGIDRLVMMLTDQHSIRDVLLFPTMRPESGEELLGGRVPPDPPFWRRVWLEARPGLIGVQGPSAPGGGSRGQSPLSNSGQADEKFGG
ncbi:MAG: hypothetical protein O7B79_12620, partial [SAR324 cluster bacterium]|nr:hypothetical protein [SAR324 cluster bacterium]